MEEIKIYLAQEERSFEDGIKLYEENSSLNPAENKAKWLTFFNANKAKKQGSLEQNMLENRLKYILSFNTFEKKKMQPIIETNSKSLLPETKSELNNLLINSKQERPIDKTVEDPNRKPLTKKKGKL